MRHVTTATRQQVFAAHRITYPPRTGAYELDHLIPLELGGGNAATNLWPQPSHRGIGSADVKDHLEHHLHTLVCSGQVRLVATQAAMAGDWWAAAARYNPIVVHRGATPARRTAANAPAESSHAAAVDRPGQRPWRVVVAPAGSTGHTLAGIVLCGETAASGDCRSLPSLAG